MVMCGCDDGPARVAEGAQRLGDPVDVRAEMRDRVAVELAKHVQEGVRIEPWTIWQCQPTRSDESRLGHMSVVRRHSRSSNHGIMQLDQRGKGRHRIDNTPLPIRAFTRPASLLCTRNLGTRRVPAAAR